MARDRPSSPGSSSTDANGRSARPANSYAGKNFHSQHASAWRSGGRAVMLCAVTDRLLHRHRPIADLAPGEHACLLYDDPEEQFALVAPYIRQGLMRGDHCVYVAADRTIDDVRRLLGDVGIDVEQQIANGRLVLLSPDRFRQPGDFDPAIMRAFLRGMVEQSVAAGFNGVRLAVEMAWALQTGVPVERLVEFESDLNATLFAAVRISAICQYDRRGYPARTLVGALRSHPLLVVGHEVFANVCHEPPTPRPSASTTGASSRPANPSSSRRPYRKTTGSIRTCRSSSRSSTTPACPPPSARSRRTSPNASEPSTSCTRRAARRRRPTARRTSSWRRSRTSCGRH